jgi:repressor LexA
MDDLTKRQNEVLAFIRETIRENDRPPTLHELMARFSWRSDNAARQHLRLLERKGALTLDPNRPRGIRLPEASRPAGLREVLLLGRVAAGKPLEALENIEGRVGIDPAIFPEEEVFALKVNGDSMTGAGIRGGDIALIRKQGEARDNDIVIALLNGEATLKRYRTRRETITLCAENPAYPDIAVTPADDFSVVGVAIGIIRRM